MTRARTPEEVIQAFRSQYRALNSSSIAFDSGELWEAARIATSIHTLLHDQGKSYKSILTQLGVRGQIRFLSSGRIPERGSAGWSPLVAMAFNDGKSRWFPRLADTRITSEAMDHRSLQFHRWWDDEKIFEGRQHKLTRKALVFALRNKEGGGHFGDLDDPRYLELVDNPLLVGAPPNVAFSMVRQIGWEVIQSLEGRADILPEF